MKKRSAIIILTVLIILSAYLGYIAFISKKASEKVIAQTDSTLKIIQNNYEELLNFVNQEIDRAHANYPCKIEPYYILSNNVKNKADSLIINCKHYMQNHKHVNERMIMKEVKLFLDTCVSVFNYIDIPQSEKQKEKFMQTYEYLALQEFSEKGKDSNYPKNTFFTQLCTNIESVCFKITYIIVSSIAINDWYFDTIWLVAVPESKLVKMSDDYIVDVNLVRGVRFNTYPIKDFVVAGMNFDTVSGSFIGAADTFYFSKNTFRVSLKSYTLGLNNYWIQYFNIRPLCEKGYEYKTTTKKIQFHVVN